MGFIAVRLLNTRGDAIELATRFLVSLAKRNSSFANAQMVCALRIGSISGVSSRV